MKLINSMTVILFVVSMIVSVMELLERIKGLIQRNTK